MPFQFQARDAPKRAAEWQAPILGLMEAISAASSSVGRGWPRSGEEARPGSWTARPESGRTRPKTGPTPGPPSPPSSSCRRSAPAAVRLPCGFLPARRVHRGQERTPRFRAPLQAQASPPFEHLPSVFTKPNAHHVRARRPSVRPPAARRASLSRVSNSPSTPTPPTRTTALCAPAGQPTPPRRPRCRRPPGRAASSRWRDRRSGTGAGRCRR